MALVRSPRPRQGRSAPHFAAVLLAPVLLVASGCSAVTTGADAPSGNNAPTASARPDRQIPTGPGPRATYTVQPQPRAGNCHYRHAHTQPLPDPACTPGAGNPDVTAATFTTTICKSGYTGDIRPPSTVTGWEKIANAASYGYTGPLHEAEYDHLISLELGGDPNDPRNL